MTDFGLSPQQLSVICALSSGVTTTTAAQEAGIHRNTVSNWRRNSLPFQHALADAHYDRALYYREKLEDLVDLAIETLRESLTDPNTPASVRQRAALAIITTAITPPPPKKQVQLDIEKIVVHPNPVAVTEDQLAPAPANPHNEAQPTAAAPAPAADSPQPAHNPAQPTAAAPAHNPAQPTPVAPAHNPAQPHRRPTPKIGRNHPCPCGSGQKYKRCCLEKDQAKAA